ncbi:alpha/beta hydrolase [Bradyrhizobium xenonodulans]|uniref:Alpha/beta hydrolase n=1 Tax=Bradyrhizobium xenonodulans TaxID=2736875 RepID=A0ABY7MG78_9BRAD|nr:alpha/beta hydrolase [Bradyrhizobium xenonodulans]WBL77423.1 alpha/beta hydrolase [Bradyrhizobium xenonodulans]
MKHLILGALLSMAASLPSSAQSSASKPISIVLVHGAFVDASGWKAVYDKLTGDGYEVLVVQNPTVTLEGDVAATRQVIARATNPVLLVGHSYGGAVITEAGSDAKVASLVYLAAFAPEAGESVSDLASKPPPGEPSAPLLPARDGFLLVDQSKFPAAFAADVDRSLTTFMAAAQMPWGTAAVQTKITSPAWKQKPTYFMLTTHDHMIPPGTQRAMAKRAGAQVREIQSSHAVMLSHPDEVVDFIKTAAEAAK